MRPFFFTLPPPTLSQKVGLVTLSQYIYIKIKLLVNNKSNHIYIIFFSFSAALILSNSGSRKTNLLYVDVVVQTWNTVQTTSRQTKYVFLYLKHVAPLREGDPEHIRGDYSSGYTAGKGILNNDTVTQTISCLNTTSDIFEIEDG